MRTLLALMCLLFLGTVATSISLSAQAADADQRMDHYEKRIIELERRLRELQDELDALKAGESEAEIESALEETSQAPPSGSEKLLPDLSVIVDTVGTVSTKREEPNRDQLLIRGLELGVQGYLYPQMRGDVFIAAEGEHLSPSVEEAYASFLQIGDTSLSAIVGKKFINFGKNNPVHREKWSFVTQPFVVRNLLNPDEGLAGQGAQINYLLPLKGDSFGQLELGIWKPSGHSHEHEEEHASELGLGIENRLYTGRLWLSRAMDDSAEMELGLSAAGGKGEEDLGQPRTRLYGLDLTYRAWGERNKRLMLQVEAMRQKRTLKDQDGSRDGYYLLGLHRLDRYNEIGLRYDWASLPAPASGHDSGLSAFYTRMLSETSYARLQATRGTSADAGDFTSAFLQFVWGLGPHAHDLQ